MNKSNSLILALPKGRVYEDFRPVLEKTQFAIKDDLKESRKMLLDTKHPSVKVLIIRGWDVPTYITSGAAHIGVVGKDILMEKEEEDSRKDSGQIRIRSQLKICRKGGGGLQRRS